MQSEGVCPKEHARNMKTVLKFIRNMLVMLRVLDWQTSRLSRQTKTIIVLMATWHGTWKCQMLDSPICWTWLLIFK